jgi:hypothetical protein
MSELYGAAQDVAQRFKRHSKKLFRVSVFVKLLLVIGGATAAAIAHCVELAHNNGVFSEWTALGLGGAAAVAVGGIYIALTETDVTAYLDSARDALEIARDHEQKMERFKRDIERLKKEIDRGLQLYNSMGVMRGAIETSLDIPNVTVERILRTCIRSARNSLEVAMDFATGDIWTICIFKATRMKESDKFTLKLVAHARKKDCKLAEAREWLEGVGVAGFTFLKGSEVVVADMLAPALGTVFNLTTTNSRTYDPTRYRSMVAIPIRILSNPTPWGVAMVTTDKRGHFEVESSGGISTSEAARAIAAMAALAVKALGDDRPFDADQREPDDEPVYESTGSTSAEDATNVEDKP